MEVPMEYPHILARLHLDPDLDPRLDTGAQSRLRSQRKRPLKCPS
jgi:hypothetical protein